MIDGNSHYELTAQQTWARGVQIYRTAVETYRRLLEARAARVGSRTPFLEPAVVSPPAPLAPRFCGLSELTPRERQIADLVAHGYTNQQIAERLTLTSGTVANHVAHILDKLGAANRTQIAARVLDYANGNG